MVCSPSPRQERLPLTTQRYQQASAHFLEQARWELVACDLAEASEKGGGATAQMLKAIADK